MPRNATEIGSRRFYQVPGAEGPLPSVTTILNLTYPAEWKGPSAAKKTAERAVRQFPELVRRMWEDGHPDAESWLKSAPREYMVAAGDYGTDLHGYLEGRMWGVASPGTSLGEMAVDAFLYTYRPEPIEIEFQVASLAHGWAGSGDLIAEIYGRNILLDLKTGFLDHKARIQLGTYRHGEFIFKDSETRPLPRIDACAVLSIPREEPHRWQLIEVEAGEAEYQQFLHLLATYQFHEAIKDAAIGELILPQALEGAT